MKLKVPKIVTDALKTHPAEKAIFDELPDSHKKAYVEWIVSAKKEDTRAARLAKLVPMLIEKQRSKS
jgi:uncharacterized protein YdeI (YjbR/CyaY-like superfamily)